MQEILNDRSLLDTFIVSVYTLNNIAKNVRQVRVLQGHTRVLRFKLGRASSPAYHPPLELKPISVLCNL